MAEDCANILVIAHALQHCDGFRGLQNLSQIRLWGAVRGGDKPAVHIKARYLCEGLAGDLVDGTLGLAILGNVCFQLLRKAHQATHGEPGFGQPGDHQRALCNDETLAGFIGFVEVPNIVQARVCGVSNQHAFRLADGIGNRIHAKENHEQAGQ